jgi:hypothetical protein
MPRVSTMPKPAAARATHPVLFGAPRTEKRESQSQAAAVRLPSSKSPVGAITGPKATAQTPEDRRPLSKQAAAQPLLQRTPPAATAAATSNFGQQLVSLPSASPREAAAQAPQGTAPAPASPAPPASQADASAAPGASARPEPAASTGGVSAMRVPDSGSAATPRGERQEAVRALSQQLRRQKEEQDDATAAARAQQAERDAEFIRCASQVLCCHLNLPALVGC